MPFDPSQYDPRMGGDPSRMSSSGKKDSSAPPPPDFSGLADKQAAANKDLLAEQTKANRPNITTPFGSQTWSQDANGKWSMGVTLDPTSQAALDAQRQSTLGRSNLANTLTGQVGKTLANPLDFSGLSGAPDADGARKQAIDASYGQASSRLDPSWKQREEATRSRLYNMGFREGDAGYQQAMGDLGRERNDAYTSALNSAIGRGDEAARTQFGMGLQQRQQGLSELLTQRGQGVNELTALLRGQQVGLPQMPGFQGAGRSSAPDLLGAASAGYGAQMDAYNAQQAQREGGMNALGSLASLFAFL